MDYKDLLSQSSFLQLIRTTQPTTPTAFNENTLAKQARKMEHTDIKLSENQKKRKQKPRKKQTANKDKSRNQYLDIYSS